MSKRTQKKVPNSEKVINYILNVVTANKDTREIAEYLPFCLPH